MMIFGNLAGSPSTFKEKMGKNGRVQQAMMDEGEHREYLSRLRSALIDENRKDRDVTADVKPFLSYKRNGLDLSIQFATKIATKDSKWALETCKENMQQVYDDSGYMWDDDDKREELMDHQVWCLPTV